MTKNKFGMFLLCKRLKRRMRQRDMAALLECAPITISQYERGTRFPSCVMIQRIAEVFGGSAEVIVDLIAEDMKAQKRAEGEQG